jgi:hypothetical protein
MGLIMLGFNLFWKGFGMSSNLRTCSMAGMGKKFLLIGVGKVKLGI